VDESAVLRGLPHAVIVVGAQGTIAYANEAAHGLVGNGSLIGRDPLDLVAVVHRARADRLLAGLRDSPGVPARLRMAGPHERWIAVRGAGGPEGTLVLSLTEVTEQTLGRRRLRRSEQRFRAAFEAATHGSALVAERGRILTVNAALAELLGRARAELVGVHVAELMDPPDVPAADWSQHGTSARRLRHAGGGLVHVLVTTSGVEGDLGERLTLVQVQDVTERRRSEQRLRHLALHDQLTDLPARHLLLERLHTALEQRSVAAPIVAALFVDLDDFKLVNDALGHAVGDLVLREAAVRLRQVTRPQDTVARLSGDEFVVVCPALAAEDEAVAIADRLSEALRAPVRTATDEVLVSASIGVAFAGPGDTTPEELLRDADAAMYRAKQLGRRRYEVFDSALRERAVERSRVRELLDRVVTQDRVVVHYQPFVELASRQVVAVEALLRLRDDDGQLLEPDRFLDVATESGLLPTLDAAVLEEAAGAVARWSALHRRRLGLAVNLCAGGIDDELADRVITTLEGSGLTPAQLLVEVTEQTLAGAGPEVAQRLQALQERGVRVALDDFGTGWGSLTYLRRLPVSMVKVDRSFVALLPDDLDGLVRAVVLLAGQLGLDASAEGVETEEQYAALRAVGPGYAQGRLFGGPVGAEDVPLLLTALGVHPDGAWPDGRGRGPRIADLAFDGTQPGGVGVSGAGTVSGGSAAP